MPKPRPDEDPAPEPRQYGFDAIDASETWLLRTRAVDPDAPRASLGGLTPRQAHGLVNAQWMTDGVATLAMDLTPDEVKDSAWLHGVRTLVRMLDDYGPLDFATSVGTDRYHALVLGLFHSARHLGMPAPRKPKPEMHIMRVHQYLADCVALLTQAGLMTWDGRTATVTDKLREMTVEEESGNLHAILALAYLDRIDLVTHFEMDEEMEPLHSTLNYTIYRLLETTRAWRSSQWLAEHATHPKALEAMRKAPEMPSKLWPVPLIACTLAPLVQLHYLEARRPAATSLPEFRQTPLFSRAVRFDLEAAGRQKYWPTDGPDN